ncbi:MAG: glycosyltransferase [Pseudomonadaceae bacterium]|nr:glycosyltransferase [Pseudomonadaceae bacterium]
MARPFFSIVTPSYNQSAYVQSCIDSVARQTFTDYEHLVFDGESTDGTVEILRSYSAMSERVKLRIGKDRGQVDAINQGFHAASGKYLIWLNTDDFFLDDSVLADVHSALKSQSVDFLYGRGEFVDPQGQKIKDVFINEDPSLLYNRLMVSVGILQPATFIKREAFEQLGDLVETHPYCFDYEYWMRGVSTGMNFEFIPRKLTRATLHNDSKTIGDRLDSLRDTCLVNKKHYGFVSSTWIDKLVECELYGADGIVSSGSENSNEKEHRLMEVFKQLNGGKAAAAAIYSKAHIAEAQSTLEALRDSREVSTKNTIVTAFDEQFFTSGLSLVSGLQSRHSEISVFVYDIGLNGEQRQVLNSLKNVFVLDFDKRARPFCENYFTPQTYGFKSYAMWHARHYLGKHDRLLWLDAGVYPLKNLNRIFDLIEDREIFLVDHDDKGVWPVHNITFTSNECLARMRATAEEMTSPALRAGVAGYKIGGRYASLFDEAFEFSLDADILCGEKHPKPPLYKTRSGGSPEERKKSVEDEAWLHSQPMEKLRQIFGYFGHRHDQSILSLLAARHGAPFQSASAFCVADDASSAFSKARWTNGAAVSASDEIPQYYRDADVELMQHRGLFRNTNDLIFEHRPTNSAPAMVMGNGPSLKNFDFKRLSRFDVFGMNAAYRYWEEINWYPTYYSCLDLVVGLSHKAEIGNLIENADRLGIRLFLLRRNLIEELGDIGRSEKVLNFDLLQNHISLLQAPTITTGSHTAAWAAVLGYNNIYMLGIDCNYVERVDGSRDVGRGTELEIVEESDNPNYFFKGYQQKGDRYNVPNPDRDIHMASWREVSQRIHRVQKSILNANLLSKVDSIDFCSFDDVENSDTPKVIPLETILGPVSSDAPQTKENISNTERESQVVVTALESNKGAVGEQDMHEERNTNDSIGSEPSSSINGRRIRDLLGALGRHAKRYGLLVVPYGLVVAGLSYLTLKSDGNTQILFLGLVLLAVFAGAVLMAAEAARRTKLHYFNLQSQLDSARHGLRQDQNRFERQLAELAKKTSTVAQMGSDVRKLKRELETIDGKVASKAPKKSIENLRDRIDQINTQDLLQREQLAPVEFEVSELAVTLESYRRQLDQALELQDDYKTLLGKLSQTVTVEQLDYKLEDSVGRQEFQQQQEQLRELQQYNSSFNEVADELTGRLQHMQTEIDKVSASDEAIEETRKLSARLDALPESNLRNYNLFNRALQPEHVKEYREKWSRALGVSLPEKAMYYMAHRFTTIESQLRGRLATNIETAVLRALVLDGVAKKSVSILEIGTLFGVGAAMLFDHARDKFDHVEITVLDPLDGYYGNALDVLSGIGVNEGTLIDNLQRAGLSEDNFRVIKHFSYEEEAIKQAGDREYDYILIDGDHTRSGIEIDFKHYSEFLTRGGVILFDDYGSDDWPDVASFVDEVVANDERFAFVGAGWRTAIYRKIA